MNRLVILYLKLIHFYQYLNFNNLFRGPSYGVSWLSLRVELGEFKGELQCLMAELGHLRAELEDLRADMEHLMANLEQLRVNEILPSFCNN